MTILVQALFLCSLHNVLLSDIWGLYIKPINLGRYVELRLSYVSSCLSDLFSERILLLIKPWEEHRRTQCMMGKSKQTNLIKQREHHCNYTIYNNSLVSGGEKSSWEATSWNVAKFGAKYVFIYIPSSKQLLGFYWKNVFHQGRHFLKTFFLFWNYCDVYTSII